MEHSERDHREDMDKMQTQFGFPKEPCSHCGERNWGNDSPQCASYYCLTCGSSYNPIADEPDALPCPRCGGDRHLQTDHSTYRGGKKYWFCYKCNEMTPIEPPEEPEWMCIQCGSLQPPVNERCKDCGQKRPDPPVEFCLHANTRWVKTGRLTNDGYELDGGRYKQCKDCGKRVELSREEAHP